MKVSIVIPLYNVALYIKDCLESIGGQSFSNGIECVIVDDCGSDNSVEVVQSFIDGYKGNVVFSLIHHNRNRGAAAARNTGIEHASGDYIMFNDGDDWITQDCVELLVKCMTTRSDIQLVQCGIKTTNSSISWFDFEKNPLPEYSNDRYDVKTRLLGKGIIPNSPCGKLISLHFVKEHGLFFYEGIVMEDELWMNLLAKHVLSVAVVNRNLYIYRIREGSVVTSGKGTDPYRKIILYDLMIQAIDEPYVEEQVDYITMLLDKLYFEHEDIKLRKHIGVLLDKISTHCSTHKRYVLKTKAILSKLDKGNRSVAYYLFYRLSLLYINRKI